MSRRATSFHPPRTLAAAVFAVFAVAGGGAAAEGAPCRTLVERDTGRTRMRCAEPAPRPEPLRPDVRRAGSEPGFHDLGGGTELRVGGRVRLEAGAASR